MLRPVARIHTYTPVEVHAYIDEEDAMWRVRAFERADPSFHGKGRVDQFFFVEVQGLYTLACAHVSVYSHVYIPDDPLGARRLPFLFCCNWDTWWHSKWTLNRERAANNES